MLGNILGILSCKYKPVYSEVVLHCCVNQPYWFKKNPSLLSFKEISFKTLKKNALVKEFSLVAKGKSFSVLIEILKQRK